jgi:hypothetical protein
LVLSIALYTIGFALPATLFLIGGGVAELMFWVRVFRHRR